MNHNAENFTSLKLLLAKHRKAKFAGKSLRARTIFAQRRPKSPLFFASVRIFPGVNSRAELVTLAPGLRPERRFAPLARGQINDGISTPRIICIRPFHFVSLCIVFNAFGTCQTRRLKQA